MKTSAAAVLLISSALAISACSSAPQVSGVSYKCYDLKGRVEPSITTKADCDYNRWDWRVSPSRRGP